MIDVKKYEQMVKDSTPGKFEGETPATAYYYELSLDGQGEEIFRGDRLDSTFFKITSEEREAFDLSVHCEWYAVWSDDQGFVFGFALKDVDKEVYLKDIQNEEDDAEFKERMEGELKLNPLEVEVVIEQGMARVTKKPKGVKVTIEDGDIIVDPDESGLREPLVTVHHADEEIGQ